MLSFSGIHPLFTTTKSDCFFDFYLLFYLLFDFYLLLIIYVTFLD